MTVAAKPSVNVMVSLGLAEGWDGWLGTGDVSDGRSSYVAGDCAATLRGESFPIDETMLPTMRMAATTPQTFQIVLVVFFDGDGVVETCIAWGASWEMGGDVCLVSAVHSWLFQYRIICGFAGSGYQPAGVIGKEYQTKSDTIKRVHSHFFATSFE
nr:hypothetical protein [Rhodococcus sp. 05-2255-1e]